MNKKILVTGTSGFMGYHVAQSLVNNGYEVVAPVRSESLNKESISVLEEKGIRIVEGNFYDHDLLTGVFNDEVFAVIHLAAIRGEGFGNWNNYESVNVNGTKVLYQFAKERNTELFVYISTAGVYGTIPKELPAKENSELNPDFYYHKSKYQGELVLTNSRDDSIKYVILRPTTVYGYLDDGFLPKLISLVHDKHFIYIKEPVLIHLLDVNFLAEIVKMALQIKLNNNFVLNIADATPVNMKEIVDLISQHFFSRNYPTFLSAPSFLFKTADRISDLLGLNKISTSIKLITYSRHYNTQLLEQTFGIKPPTSLDKIRSYLKTYY